LKILAIDCKLPISLAIIAQRDVVSSQSHSNDPIFYDSSALNADA
jgi:hypothetical protein